MWEHDWAGSVRTTPIPDGERPETPRAGLVAPLFWEEHCVECAAPACYTTCPLYVRRSDGLCARFEGGIQRHPGGPGASSSGAAEVRFRRWGKLVTDLPNGFVSPRWIRAAVVVDRLAGRAVRSLARVLPGDALGPRVRSAYGWRRQRYFRRQGQPAWDAAQLVVDVWNVGPEPVDLFIEHSRDGIVRMRRSWPIAVGHNHVTVPLTGLGPHAGIEGSRLMVGPAGDIGAHLVFDALDVVVPSEATATADRPVRMVKCVAWDLDNTLWAGTLAEASPEELVVDARVAEIVRHLDERGIVQTIVSKNDEARALEVLERTGLRDLFVFPTISWRPKSEGLRAVAEKLNLGLDSVLFVDDSAFERAEVVAALPSVRVLDVVDLDTMLDRPDLDVAPSEEGRSRRLRYREEERRRAARGPKETDYESFVRSCEIVAKVFVPVDEADITRCVELIQRSNQLNLSGRRHTRQDIDDLAAAGTEWFAIHAEDVFGTYGIMAVMGVERAEDDIVVRDLCVSCRAANRFIEQASLDWLRRTSGATVRVTADLVPTERNGALRATLEDCGFRNVRDAGVERFVLEATAVIPGADIVTFVDLTSQPSGEVTTAS